jgi:sec-independent protein translocase protein TatB
MFDIDAGKILILGVIALIVLGPKELPRVMRQVGSALGKMRRMAAEFQTQFMDAMKESEMEELKKDMQKMADQAKVDINYDPVSDTNRQIREAIDGKPADAPQTTASASGSPAPAPDPDNAVYTVDIPPPAPAAAPVQTASVASSPAPEAQPARKAGEA